MAESTVVACPNCGKKYKISADKLGRTFKCTGCETRFAAGAEPDPTPPPAQESSDTESSYEQTAAPPTTVDYSASGGKPKASGMAVASLIFGLLSCVPVANLLAILFGFLGLKKAKSGLAGGKGLAITGIILGVLGILADTGVVAVVIPAVVKGKHALLEAVVTLNMGQIYRGINDYQGKNDQHYPPNLGEAWKASTLLSGTTFVSPLTKDTPAADSSKLDSGGHNSYTYIYPGPEATSVGAKDVLLYQKWTDMTDDVAVLFGDGHIETVKPMEAQRMISETGKHPAATMP